MESDEKFWARAPDEVKLIKSNINWGSSQQPIPVCNSCEAQVYVQISFPFCLDNKKLSICLLSCWEAGHIFPRNTLPNFSGIPLLQGILGAAWQIHIHYEGPTKRLLHGERTFRATQSGTLGQGGQLRQAQGKLEKSVSPTHRLNEDLSQSPCQSLWLMPPMASSQKRMVPVQVQLSSGLATQVIGMM